MCPGAGRDSQWDLKSLGSLKATGMILIALMSAVLRLVIFRAFLEFTSLFAVYLFHSKLQCSPHSMQSLIANYKSNWI